MARTLSGSLPPGARLAIGLMTVAVFSFAGMTMAESRPAVGYTLLALAVFRALQWLREVRWALTPDPDDAAEDDAPAA